jgi:hypothetical protein
MTLPAGPKIDCHIHAIDPVRFPYSDDTPYRPSGQEIAPAAQLIRVLDVFDVRHALVVATNTGYGSDSRILLDTLRAGNGRFKGVAVVEKDVDVGELERLKQAGVVGIAYNAPFHGADYYRDTGPLVETDQEIWDEIAALRGAELPEMDTDPFVIVASVMLIAACADEMDIASTASVTVVLTIFFILVTLPLWVVIFGLLPHSAADGHPDCLSTTLIGIGSPFSYWTQKKTSLRRAQKKGS